MKEKIWFKRFMDLKAKWNELLVYSNALANENEKLIKLLEVKGNVENDSDINHNSCCGSGHDSPLPTLLPTDSAADTDGPKSAA